jgi:hypothetical protein
MHERVFAWVLERLAERGLVKDERSAPPGACRSTKRANR